MQGGFVSAANGGSASGAGLARGADPRVVTKGPLGNVQIRVSADADLGDGVRRISGVFAIEIQGPEAVSLSILAGTPVSRL